MMNTKVAKAIGAVPDEIRWFEMEGYIKSSRIRESKRVRDYVQDEARMIQSISKYLREGLEHLLQGPGCAIVARIDRPTVARVIESGDDYAADIVDMDPGRGLWRAGEQHPSPRGPSEEGKQTVIPWPVDGGGADHGCREGVVFGEHKLLCELLRPPVGRPRGRLPILGEGRAWADWTLRGEAG